MSSVLLEKFNFLDKEVKNRIVVPPSDSRAQRDGRISHYIFDYYLKLVKQNASIVILDNAYVAQQGKSHLFQLGLSEEEHINGLKNLVKILNEEGACVGIRLSHAGAKTNEKICGEQPIGPSVLNFGKDYDMSREFDEDDIEEIAMYFEHAIERAEEIGFQFVELNAAQQYLFDQCINPRYNRRDDEYGGSLENRMRLTLTIIERMKKRVGNRMPISYFFSIHDKLENSFDQNELRRMIKMLEDASVDIFHPITIHVMNKFFEGELTLLEWVAMNTFKPIIVEGNIKSTSVLKEVLALGKSQMYCIDKALFSRQNWYQFLHKKTSLIS